MQHILVQVIPVEAYCPAYLAGHCDAAAAASRDRDTRFQCDHGIHACDTCGARNDCAVRCPCRGGPFAASGSGGGGWGGGGRGFAGGRGYGGGNAGGGRGYGGGGASHGGGAGGPSGDAGGSQGGGGGAKHKQRRSAEAQHRRAEKRAGH
jgi:hypothetical protein